MQEEAGLGLVLPVSSKKRVVGEKAEMEFSIVRNLGYIRVHHWSTLRLQRPFVDEKPSSAKLGLFLPPGRDT